MPIQIDGSAANHTVVRARGKLSKDEIIQLKKDFEVFIKDRGTLRVLLDATELDGWDSGSALWQEVIFDFKYLPKIDRLAMVGSKPWQKTLEAALKPFAHPTMRYFEDDQMQQAHDWLIAA